MSPSEWRRAGGMAAVIVGLHVVGFGLLILVVVPAKYKLGAAGTFAIGTGVAAYTLGLRHAFDADHIAAIDNTTRKLMSEGKRPLSVGFFFSLGHSTIVFMLAFLIALGVRALDSPIRNNGSALHKATTVIGTTVSAAFAAGEVNVKAAARLHDNANGVVLCTGRFGRMVSLKRSSAGENANRLRFILISPRMVQN